MNMLWCTSKYQRTRYYFRKLNRNFEPGMVIHSCNSSNKGRALSFQSSLEYTMSTMLAAATQKDPVRSKQKSKSSSWGYSKGLKLRVFKCLMGKCTLWMAHCIMYYMIYYITLTLTSLYVLIISRILSVRVVNIITHIFKSGKVIL